MPFLCNPFRGRSSRFWIILLVSFKLLFDLAVFVLYSRNSAVNNSQIEIFDGKISRNDKVITRSTQLPPVLEIGQKLNTRKPVLPTKTPTKKPTEIDMVNDYQPWIDFKFVYPEVQPIIEVPRDFYVVVLVNSGAKGDGFRRRRAKIRETWASKKTCEHLNAMNNTKLRDKRWILVFVVGKAGGEDDKRNIEEAKEHNDMLIGDINDNYLNNILKYYMGQLWASLLGTKYTLKTDDDVYMRIPKVIEYLVSQGSPTRFYGGETYPNSAVFRSAGGKWSISKKYFPETVFPPFNAGAFILMSMDLFGSLMNYVYIRKPFHTDDAYVGVAMRDFKVKVVDIVSFEINHNMAEVIRSRNNCDILKLIAHGHSVDTGTMQHLHGRIEALCRNGTALKNC